MAYPQNFERDYNIFKDYCKLPDLRTFYRTMGKGVGYKENDSIGFYFQNYEHIVFVKHIPGKKFKKHYWSRSCWVPPLLHRLAGPAMINFGPGTVMHMHSWYYINGKLVSPSVAKAKKAEYDLTKQGSKDAGVNLDV